MSHRFPLWYADRRHTLLLFTSLLACPARPDSIHVGGRKEGAGGLKRTMASLGTIKARLLRSIRVLVAVLSAEPRA